MKNLKNPKSQAGGPKMVDGRSPQLPLNKFFDPSTTSMRKGCDGEKKRSGRGRKEN